MLSEEALRGYCGRSQRLYVPLYCCVFRLLLLKLPSAVFFSFYFSSLLQDS